MDSTENITSLNKLLEILPSCEGQDYFDIARNLSIPDEDLLPYAFWSEESYTRNCVLRTDDFELLLLCWEQDQDTPIHCHNGEECWVYLANGKLQEKRYVEENDELKLIADVKMTQDRLSYMNDDLGYHSLQNINEGKSMSLHLYVGPIDECSIYDEDKNKFIFKELDYYSENKMILTN
ncbi:cysteine dioxygenase family protein [Psychroflexus sp. CAK57W]|uniref:cysteine dioxygenase n=1 Tax=Psychroflexus curvus TaxID=2873595 RepID=UPI001CCA081F|nr:cysteine dioxygenase family protein [Psychroflexus curvus]MBZ9626711.1 cysteine dioxygenase family protein [Psychroflexus curvus]MBZ9786487.1 cysteine dioxygenase family protein [Psychroflexus curvus]